MRELTQNQREHLENMVQQGKMTTAQANVEMVRYRRVVLVTRSLPQALRSAYREAVKDGRLGHKTKDGRKPEVYFHPTFEHLVAGERAEYERKILFALAATCSGDSWSAVENKPFQDDSGE